MERESAASRPNRSRLRPFSLLLAMGLVAGASAARAQPCFQPQQPKLIPPLAHGHGGDWFGSVCIRGDVAMIGAMQDDERGTNAGAVYVYGRNPSGLWVPNARLFADEPAPHDLFGADIAIEGDLAFVGAWYDDHSGLHDAGSVFVFERSGGSWVRSGPPITASDAEAGDNFGVGIAVQGALLLVGASTGDNDDLGVMNCGVVYVFERNAQGTWVQQDKFAAPPADCDAYDGFGADLGLVGDTVVVGAWLDDDGPGSPRPDAGAAYLYRRNAATGAFEFEWKFVAAAPDAYDHFGEAVVLQGEMALIGAHRWDDDEAGKLDVGGVYVFRRNGWGAWDEITTLRAPDREPYDLFGVRLSMDGDTLMVGAFGDDEGAWNDCGSAYVFDWVDHDLDGVPDSTDACPDTIAGVPVDGLGCPPLSPGDCGRDGDVDVLDFAGVSAALRGPGQPPAGGCPAADADGDGDADLADFARVQGCFSGSNLPSPCATRE